MSFFLGVALWCANFNAPFASSDLQYATDPDEVVIALAKGACSSSPEANGNRSQIEAARSSWNEKLGMVDADWADVVDFAKRGERTILEFNLSTKLLSDATPIDQYQRIKSGDDSQPWADVPYLADALESKLTEPGRLAVVAYCLKSNFSTYGEGPGNAVRWGMCGTDLKKFDRKKFNEQVRSDTAHTGAERMGLRFKAYDLLPKIKEQDDKIQKLFAQDPAYKTIFATAAAAEAEWDKIAKANAKTLELALKLESASLAGSRRAFEGCDAAATEALTAALRAVPAKELTGMHDDRANPRKSFASGASAVLAKYPAVQLAAIPYLLCNPRSGKSFFLAAVLGTGPGLRGPRTAAQDRILTRVANKEIQLDDMQARLAMPSFSSRPFPRAKSDYASSFGGVVKTMKPDGAKIGITVETTKITFTGCVKEDPKPHFTGYRIDGSGNLVATSDHICLQSGPVTQDNTWQPFSIEASDDKLVKAGTLISAASGADGTASVLATWSDKAAAAPSTLLGAALNH